MPGESEPRYVPDIPEEGPEVFDEAAALVALAEAARELLPDLDEEDYTYLAGLGIDMSTVTNPEGEIIVGPVEKHLDDFADALNYLQTLAIQHGVEEEFTERLIKAGVFE